MELSIIIVNFNTEKLVKDCISSIKKNTDKVKYEIIVVDNGSEKPITETKDARYIFNKENLGFAKANNQGIKIAKGEYILLLNSDTVVKPQAIDKLLEFAKEHPEAGAVAPKLLNEDGSIQGSLFMLPTIWRAIKQYWFGQKQLLDKYASQKGVVLVESAVMAAFLITPKALKKVGMLNEKYFMYFEDMDYCREIMKAGLNIYYFSEAEIIHLHGASGGKNQYLIEASKKYFGNVQYYIYTFVLWSGQKLTKII